MLLQMRTFTRSWAAYALLFVLTVAFAIWGINDVFQPTGSENIAKVGDRGIRPAQLSRELELTLRAQRNQGQNITQADAINEGVHLQLLDGMITRFALYNYADKLGVSASDADVQRRIIDIPSVTNPVTGNFDQAAYDAFLQQLRYNRIEFEGDIRGDLTSDMLMEALVAGLRAPSSFGALAVSYEGETRVVSIADAPVSVVGAPSPPTEAQLQTFWEESQERLRVPEFRALTLVYADPQAFLARVDVPEQRLREEFEARRVALTRPERRTYVRISAQNEQQANDAAARLGRGESADAVASALGLQATRGENQARTDVPDARVAEAVFSLSRGQARAVRGALSPWAVVRLEGVTPAVSPDFAAVRDQLRLAIAQDEAGEMLNDAVGAFEDARAGGATLADAARQHGLTVVAVPAVEAGGRDPSGAPVEALAGEEELLTTAFQTPEGEASDFIPAGSADVFVSVDRVTPSTVRPLDQVRAELTQVWINRERGRRMRELGEEVVEAVRGGQSFAAAARAHRFNVVVASRALDRRTASQIPARALATQIFAGREGDVTSDMRADGRAFLVAAVERIDRVDPSEQPQAVAAMRAQMEQNLLQSVGNALQDEVVARSRVSRNERLLNQVFPRSGAEGEEEGQ
jgi:peptidyl-prolyl cis-trans isomerase D